MTTPTSGAASKTTPASGAAAKTLPTSAGAKTLPTSASASAPSSRTSPAVRPDIQALRAFAIISVTLFHFWPNNFGGGFVGVDIFFVISGFLITGALWREAEAGGKIRFAAFWARRARRLLPASLLVILLSSVAALLIAMPIGYLSFADEATSSTLYFENFTLLAKNTDYLTSGGDLSPFQHFWSLSVEEQFYLVWPLLMFLGLLTAGLRLGKLAAGRKRGILLWLSLVSLASFAFNVWQTYQLQPVAYFSTAARAWEFAVGGLVAVWLSRPTEVEVRRKPWWFIAGALAVFYSATMFDQQTLFPGFAALLPVLGAAALIYAGQSTHHLMPRAFINLKPWQFLGDISYSLYLWHWPLIILLTMWWGRDFNNVGKMVIFAVAIVLGWLTKRFVEDPIRFRRISRAGAIWQLGFGLLAMLLTVGATLGLSALAQNRVETSWANTHLKPSLLKLHDDFSSIEKNQNCTTSPSSTDFEVCLMGYAGQKGNPGQNGGGTKQIALIGDSHARQLFDAVNAIAIRHRVALYVISKSHCEPMASQGFPADYTEPTCRAWNQKLETYLASRPAFDLIINMNASNYSITSADAPAAFKHLVQTQLARGTKWLVVKDNPVPMNNLTSCLELLGPAAVDDCAVTPEVGFKHADHLAEVIKELPGVIYADFSDVICPAARCAPFIGADIVYRDTNHLTRTFVEKYLQPRLEALLSKELSE